MNKTAILLIGAILLGSMNLASCKKKNNEPIPAPVPTPTPTPTPPPNNEDDNKPGDYEPIVGKDHTNLPDSKIEDNTIVFQVSSRQFLVAALEGKNIQVDGVVETTFRTGGKDVNQKYTVKEDGVVTFRGEISRLAITAGAITRAYVQKAPKSLITFALIGTRTKTVNLSQPTNITSLTIRNQDGMSSIDLSAQTRLKKAYLGRLGVGNQGYGLTKVSLPSPSVLEVVDISDTGVNDININDNHPMLKTFHASAAQVQEITLPHSPNIESVWVRRSSGIKKITLNDRPNLREVVLNESLAGEVSITNAPKLKDGLIENRVVKGGFLFAIGKNATISHPVTKLDLSGTGITKFAPPHINNLANLTELILKKTTIKDFDPSIFSKINKLDIQGASIEDDTLNKIIDGLPQGTNAKLITSKQLTDEQKNKLTKKGWTVENK